MSAPAPALWYLGCAAAAVDVQVGVEEAVLVEKDDRQAVMPEEPVKIVALGVAFVVPPSRRRRGSLRPWLPPIG